MGIYLKIFGFILVVTLVLIYLQWHGSIGVKNNLPQNSTSTTSTTPATSTVGTTSTTTSTTGSVVVRGVQSANNESAKKLSWGAYVGDPRTNLSSFESLVGKRVNIVADFEGWGSDGPFPLDLANVVGGQGKILLIFWEPNFGYDNIINGSEDTYIKQFATDAKTYGYPIILVPFDEMNLNEESWGYSQNGNTSTKFVTAWQHIHDLFAGVSNVKFAIDFNYQSIPHVPGNTFGDYYPGNNFVDYVGLSGFNFGTPWKTFDELFTSGANILSMYEKPLYIFSTATGDDLQKGNWISEGLGKVIETYPKIAGWVWFNANKEQDWRINSNDTALQSFKKVIP